MSGPPKLSVYDSHGTYDAQLAVQLVSGIELTSPAPDAFLEHFISFIVDFPQILQQETDFEPLSEIQRNHIVQVFRGFQEPASSEYLRHHAPILGDLFLETLTYYMGPIYATLRGSGCLGTRDNALCGRETCIPTYSKKSTSFTYGTCGLLSCAQNRLVFQLRDNNLKRTRRNFDLTFAWLGDAIVENETHGSLSGTPAAQLDPSRVALLALREDLVSTATRERAAGTPSVPSPPSDTVDTPEGSIPEGNYGLSPVHIDDNIRTAVGALAPPLAPRAPQLAEPTISDAGLASLVHHPLANLHVEAQPQPRGPAPVPTYIPPHLRPSVEPLAIPIRTRDAPTATAPHINPQPVTAPQPMADIQGRVPSADTAGDLLSRYVADESRRQEQQRQAAAGISIDLLLSAVAPKDGIEGLVSGAVDGLVTTDLDSPSALHREMRENYSGNGTTKVDKLLMRRSMQVDTLGDSAELQHTPLRVTQESLTMSGSKLLVKDRLQFPRRDRFLTYCRKRIAEWNTIQHSGLGVFSTTHESCVFHIRTALLIQARYGFMIELVEHAGLEWSWCTWESLFVYLTAKYVSAWELQPYTRAVRLDRDLLGFQHEGHGDLRDVFRQYVVDTISPTQCMSIGGHYLCDPYRMAMATELPDGDTDSDDVVSSCDCSMCRRERDGEDSDSGSGFDSDYY
eukprot:gene16017-18997_t